TPADNIHASPGVDDESREATLEILMGKPQGLLGIRGGEPVEDLAKFARVVAIEAYFGRGTTELASEGSARGLRAQVGFPGLRHGVAQEEADEEGPRCRIQTREADRLRIGLGLEAS